MVHTLLQEWCFFLPQMNLKGLKNLDIDSTMNARGVVSYLKAKLTKVGK